MIFPSERSSFYDSVVSDAGDIPAAKEFRAGNFENNSGGMIKLCERVEVCERTFLFSA